jgi:hypothetical protein
LATKLANLAEVVDRLPESFAPLPEEDFAA